MPHPVTSRLGRDRDGNVSVVFALSLVPMIGLVGLGVDYGVALSAKSKLDNAADAAAIAAVATAKSYVATYPNDPNLTGDAIAAGVDRAARAFAVNAGAIPYAAVPAPTIDLVRNGQTFSSSVKYKTSSLNNFGRMFNQNTTGIAGSTAASADVPSYLDFYLMIDVSGSMGLPSTTAGQSRLIALNTQSPDPFPNTTQGCVFACHFNGYHGWSLAVGNNIQLRSGAVNTAVCGLLTLAGKPLVTNQYRVGIYPFITQLGTLSGISSPLASANLSADCASSSPQAFTNLLDTGESQEATGRDPSTGTGSGGTNFGQVLPVMQSTISSGGGYGDGSSATKRRPFVFLVTDGMQNGQYYGTYSGKWYYPGTRGDFPGYGSPNFTGSSPQAVDPKLCANLKAAGATISILYIPYLPIPVNPDPYNENGPADNAIPNLPNALMGCASTGYFYTANSPADINNALANMFNQAVQAAHLLR